MSAAFDNTAFVHDANHVGIAYGREPVRNHQCSTVLHQAFECLLDQLLALAIEGAGGFVQYQYGWILEYGSRYGYALALASAEAAAAVADIGLITLGTFDDKVVSISDTGGLLYLLLGGSGRRAEGDIIEERVVEQYSFLIDITHKRTQVVYAHIADINAVDVMLPLSTS